VFFLDYNRGSMAEDSQPMLPFDEEGEVFESLSKENGKRSWSARVLMKGLGYESWATFKKVIQKAISACSLIGADVFAHFVPSVQTVDGRQTEDYQLTRFACGMTALNADSSKPNVAALQAHFVSIAEVFAEHRIEHAESMDRLAIRDEISDREIMLSETAASAGVENQARFRVAGYVAMYDMDYQSLRKLRGVSNLPKRSILDFMGKDELAGNLFRIAMTDGRIKKEGTRGQGPLEHVASSVGRRVRRMMHDEIGKYPEQLPTSQDIVEVRKGLKKAGSEIGSIDNLDEQRQIEGKVISEMMPHPSPEGVPGCAECAGGNPAPHYGSPHCTSGSIASGGTVAHCACDCCY